MNKIILSLLFLGYSISGSSILDLNHSHLNEISLDKTDKSSAVHNYTPIYDSYFHRFKDTPLTLLEIGFAGGGSAQMWDQYFPHPETCLYFLDINQECFKYTHKLSSRCTLYMADQEKENDLLSTMDKINKFFDIIIDDGGHTMNQQKISFEALFPYIKSGGVYIIEDLHTSYWKLYGAEGAVANPIATEDSTTEFLKKLVDDVNLVAAYTGTPNRKLAKKIVDGTFTGFGSYNFSKSFFNTLTYNQEHILSVHFYNSLCFIFKR